MPVDKQVGDQVIGATINQEGVIRVKVSAVGSESLFGKIITMVEAAGVSQAPVARLADRVCAYFVPGVLLVALATLVGWILSGASAGVSIDHAIAVLVISCPCAWPGNPRRNHGGDWHRRKKGNPLQERSHDGTYEPCQSRGPGQDGDAD